MTDIVNHRDWEGSERGQKDMQRHREKIDEYIRKSVKNVIAEESIITSKGNKTVKIPVRGLKDYRFVHGSNGEGKAGIGQGPAKPGDVIGRKQKQGQQGQGNKAGNQLGEDMMETEVDIDYLIKIMFEDLGLPYIEDRQKSDIMVPVGWKFKSIIKNGVMPQLHKKRSVMETIKRTAAYVGEIINETGCEEDDAYRALVQALGDLDEAITIVKEGRVDPNVNPEDIFIEDDDLRFRQLDEALEPHSSAVVFAMIDSSGSMDTDKKYLARSFLFWMVQFLKKSYDSVQIEFIVHTTEAKSVDEETFFRRGESGGTNCHTAFDMMDYLIETKYPVEQHNLYGVYCSDGEDWDVSKTIQSMKKLVDRKINMLSYVEILPSTQHYYGGDQGLLETIVKNFNFKISTEAGKNYYKDDEKHILACRITSKDEVYAALKHTLFEKKKG